jgi:4'-phosphopantetheinyl transferase
MIEIIQTKLTQAVLPADFSKSLHAVDAQKCKRITSFYHWQDAQRCLLGDLLVRHYLINRFGYDNREIVFAENEFGKPYLPNLPLIEFNLSHSGDWITAAFSESAVGIDVQEIKKIDLDIARRFFSKAEYSDLIKFSGEQCYHYFYSLWTLKESYIKACGKGLSIPLNSFMVNALDEKNPTFYSDVHREQVFFKQIPFDDGHKCAVCSFQPIEEYSVSSISALDLIGFFISNKNETNQ